MRENLLDEQDNNINNNNINNNISHILLLN